MKKVISVKSVFLGLGLVLGFVTSASAQNMPFFQNQGIQQSAMPLSNGFVAPPPRQVQENPAYMTQGNSCSSNRYDNSRMQNGQLMPAGPSGMPHQFGM